MIVTKPSPKKCAMNDSQSMDERSLHKHSRKKSTRKKARNKPITWTRHQKPAERENSGIISKLHQINKEMKKCSKEEGAHRKMDGLHNELQKLGGLEAYQRLSKAAELHHGNVNTSSWIRKQLIKFRIKPPEEKLKLLDVGALSLNYVKQENWIETTAIDLNPQHKDIIKCNFLKHLPSCIEVYDVIVLSLVLNFPGDPKTRGDMLKRAAALCRIGGHIFVVLPAACLKNSPYLTAELLDSMMSSLGLKATMSHYSKKLAYKMYCKTHKAFQSSLFRKKVVRPGGGKNNFCIVFNS